MPTPPLPTNEEDRLKELMDFDILDTPREEFFDLITKLAAIICGVDKALITFIDKDRQWFKSNHHFPGDARETPREVAFCSYTILNDDVMEVDDATQDERFKENPLVTSDPYIRFYAGAPLKTQRGHNLGSLCVIDDKPHTLSDEQRKELAELSRITMKMLEMRRMMTKKDEENWRNIHAEKTKEQVMANMSHELITPLNAIVGFSQLLDGELKNKEHQAYVTHILERSQYLLRMIVNILDFTKSQLDADQFIYEKAVLSKEVQLAVNTIQKTLDVENNAVIIEVDSKIKEACIDRYWFKQIMSIYISMACELVDRGEVIHVSVMPRDKQNFLIKISGVLSAKQNQNVLKLFEPDSAGYSEVRERYFNLDLSLSFVRNAVEAQGGTISADILSDKQFAFNVRLPNKEC